MGLWFHGIVIPRVQELKIVNAIIRHEANRQSAIGPLLFKYTLEILITQFDLVFC